MSNYIAGLPRPPATAETKARVCQPGGTRSFQAAVNSASGLLVDEHGRLIVRPASATGFSSPTPAGTPDGSAYSAGSAPAYDNVGLVQTHRVMQSPTDLGLGSGQMYVSRMFGYAAVAGWVQLHLRDESGGVNPPVLGAVPEITIAVGANTNFSFGDWLIEPRAGQLDMATYIAFSSTGPTYTAGGANMWFAFHGGL